jgi:hypothetical protein
MISSTKQLRNIVDNYSGWEAALIDAELQIAEMEKRAEQLRATASIIRKMIASSEPWPGESEASGRCATKNAIPVCDKRKSNRRERPIPLPASAQGPFSSTM